MRLGQRGSTGGPSVIVIDNQEAGAYQHVERLAFDGSRRVIALTRQRGEYYRVEIQILDPQ